MRRFIHTAFSRIACLALGALLGTSPGGRADAPPFTPVPGALYARRTAPAGARVEDLLRRMTQPEKLSLLALDSRDDALRLDLPAIPRLGVPPLRTTDAPQGLRDGPATAFPMEVVMASTWDPALVTRVGAAIGLEARAKNREVVYGPCVNIQRTPQGGRYFENFSEDPFLSAQMAAGYVRGMQGQGVAACIKHFVCNDQETGRHSDNVVVDERTLNEIYLPPFRAAARRGPVWALMPALTQVNGLWAAQSAPLLTDVLRTRWGWDGLIISDWGGVHSTAGAAQAGTDVEMENPVFFSPDALTAALGAGQITQAQIDDKVRHVLRLMVRTGMLDYSPPTPPAVVNSPAHQALARQVALEGVTLLKNARGLLPLDRHKIKTVAVIGPNAEDTQLGGRWSADVTPFYRVSVLDGLRKRLGDSAVPFAAGCPRTGSSTPGDIAAAAALAAKSDAAVVVVGTDSDYEGEERDPPDLFLPGDQEKLIRAVAAANRNTVVVLNCGTPLLVQRWLPRVAGLVEAWYSGQEAGSAVAAILLGDADPSGRLAGTWAADREDYSDWDTYPGADGLIHYTEGQFVGYRHFDKDHVKPLFPFGFGLSYTTFAFSGLRVPSALGDGEAARVQVTVRNTGKRAGAEVIQLYVAPQNPGADRPVRQLKGFARVSLRPGQTKTVTLPLDSSAFSFWDVKQHRWQTAPGEYAVEVGASSRDIRLTEKLRVH